MTSRVIPVDPFTLVVFGATGDLARRKLLPAMLHRDMAGQLPRPPASSAWRAASSTATDTGTWRARP